MNKSNYFITGSSIKNLQRFLVFICTFLLTAVSLANPVLDHVGSGQVSFSQSPNTLTINQASQKAILNWRSFNIDANESTHFQQPVGGIALNRISPLQGASSIYGKLTATGQIILMNPAGIYFGPNAYVNVGGLIATTANLTDQNFLNNHYNFQSVPGYNGAVVNEGYIVAAQHGLAALVAPSVVNNGMIEANLGTVILGSAQGYTLDFAGDGLVNFAITEATQAAGVDKNGNRLRDGVTNNGAIFADGGRVLVSAKAASGVLDRAINMNGIVEAKSVQQRGGEIIFGASPQSGVVKIAAKVKASGKKSGEKGGKVFIMGDDILFDAASSVDVSGDSGGGSIQIGRDHQGTLANSTIMAPGVSLDASTLYSDGGLIETSGKYLDINGIKVNTLSTYGKTGTWLLDPYNITISSAMTSNGNYDSGNPTNTFTATNTPSNVNNSELNNNLASTNVTITTAGAGADAGDITVSDPITWTSTNTLSLIANHFIAINAPITGLNGGLTLSAVGAFVNAGTGPHPIQSITTSANGAVNVANFYLQNGNWYQVNNILPAFNVTNNFSINIPGSVNNSLVGFTRAVAGDGSLGNPYQITDVYGLQGIATNNANGSLSWIMNNSINASQTLHWNNGAGFFPIGGTNLNNGLVGTFNGNNFVIDKLYINRPDTNIGLFGEIADYGNGAYQGVVKNLGLTNVNISGGLMTGGLVGFVSVGGEIYNSYVTGSVTGTPPFVTGLTGVGGLVGFFQNGIIDKSFSMANVNSPTKYNYAGGLIGRMGSGNVTDSYAMGSVKVTGSTGGQSSSVGGLIGLMSGGSVSNSFSTGAPTLTTTGSKGGFIGNYFGGGLSQNFWDTDTSGLLTSSGAGANLISGKTTQDMQDINTFLNAGWGIDQTPNGAVTWNITNNTSYPFLSYFNNAPRVVSGTVPGLAGSELNLVINGNLITSTTIGNNDSFYFLTNNTELLDNTLFLLYATGGNNNLVTLSGGIGASSTGLTIPSNTIQIGNGLTTNISLSDILALRGAFASSDILFSGTGPTSLTVNNGVNLVTSGTTTLTLSNHDLLSAGNSNFTFNGPVVVSGNSNINSGSAGNQVYNSTLAINGTNSVTLGGQNLTFTNGISGTNTQTLTLMGNAINLTQSVAPTFAIDLIGQGANPNATIDYLGGDLTFNITGNDLGSYTFGNFSNIQNFNLSSGTNHFILNGGSLSQPLVGGAGNNILTANDTSNTWHITGVDSGDVTGLPAGFSNFQTLIGGNLDDTFIFSDGARITQLIDGGNISGPLNLNTLDYSAYSTPITVYLINNIISGHTDDSSLVTINGFNNINNLIANPATSNAINLQMDKTNVITVTNGTYGLGPINGFIDDPTYFTSFTTITPFFASINSSPGDANVYPIIEQGEGGSFQYGVDQYNDGVSNNVDDILREIKEIFDVDLDNVKVNPYCATTGSV